MNKTPCYRREGDPNPAWSLDPSLDTDTNPNPDPRPGRIQTYSARSQISTWMNGAVSVIAELLVDVLINLWPLFLCILIIQKATKTCLWVYTVPKVIYRIGARRLGSVLQKYVHIRLRATSPCVAAVWWLYAYHFSPLNGEIHLSKDQLCGLRR